MLGDWKSLKVLPIVVLYIISTRMSTLSTENLNLEKACLVNIRFNDSICGAMVLRNKSGYSAEQEIKVQKLVTSMVALKSVILGIFPLIILLFVGSWGDRTRIRKPFIILPIYGDVVMNIGCLICTIFYRELPMEVAIFFEAVPVALTGTKICFFVGIFSYVSENSTVQRRTFLVGMVGIFSQASFNIGIALSGVLHKALGFYGVYFASTTMCIVAITYGNIFIQDVSKYKRECSRMEFLKDVFNYKHILGTASVLFANQARKRNIALILLFVVITLKIGSTRGEAIVTYMFTRRKFTWNEIDFSTYNTYHFFINMAGLVINILIFVKWLKSEDSVIGMITVPFAVVGYVAYSVAPNTFYFYLASLPELLAGSVYMVEKSMMSKLVSKNELGQVFSVAAALESLGPLIFGPFYGFVYHRTIHSFPGAFYAVSALIHLVIFFAFVWLHLLKTTKIIAMDRSVPNEEDKNLSCELEVTKMMAEDTTAEN